ncbi:MAG: DUF4097 family beta strand repeat-containing protein [Thermoanaerobaculia bacterium]
MKKIAMLMLATTLSVSAAGAGELKETIDRTLIVRAGSDFKIDNVNGQIEISGWDQPNIRIRATKRVESRDDDTAREALKALKVEIRQSGNSVEVDTIHPRKGDSGFMDFLFGTNVNMSVSYEINVPRAMNVSADNVNGAIHLSDVSGKIELDTTNGKIEVARCSGSVDAETTNGGISVELMTVTAGREMSFETTNGRIALTVPATLAAEINAATTNGSVRSDLPLTTSRFSRTSVKGSLNGGGPEIRLRTTNGGIDIRSTGSDRARS